MIADSLAFEFDRDRGMITLTTQNGFKHAVTAFSAPPIKFKKLSAPILADTQPVPRRLVTAQIDGQPFTMHVDFGATASAAARSLVAEGGAGHSATGRHRDRRGRNAAQDRPHGRSCERRRSETSRRQNVEFVPYVDKRWHDEDLEGTLGLDFFHGQTVLVNWDQDAIYTKPRGDLVATTAARIERWQGSLMPKCDARSAA